jgi:hypothetical protein
MYFIVGIIYGVLLIALVGVVLLIGKGERGKD